MELKKCPTVAVLISKNHNQISLAVEFVTFNSLRFSDDFCYNHSTVDRRYLHNGYSLQL